MRRTTPVPTEAELQTKAQLKAATVSPARRPLFWAAILVAVLMCALTAIPANVWHQPVIDGVYTGLDPNLVFLNPAGYPLPEKGVISISNNTLEATAAPGSAPSFHFATTPLPRLIAGMDVRILRADQGTVPYRLGIWSPRSHSGAFLVFGAPPLQNIWTETIQAGEAAQTLVGGTVVRSAVVGTYELGVKYHVAAELDKRAGTIVFRIKGESFPPIVGQILTVIGGPSAPTYGDVSSKTLTVIPGTEYRFGALAKAASGADAFKIALLWNDSRGQQLGVANDWQSVQVLNGWTPQQYLAKAPPGASSAKLLLGSGNGTVILFANPFVSTADSANRNLLANPNWTSDASDWRFPSGGNTPRLSRPTTTFPVTTFTTTDAPDLFQSLRLSVSGTSVAPSGFTRLELSNFTLTLPHESYFANKVDDLRSTLFIVLLGLAGFALIFWAIYSRRRRSTIEGKRIFSSRRLAIAEVSVISTVTLVAYLVPNFFLFGLASHPFDMGAEQLWAYISSRYGLGQLYYLANLVSPAQAWGGAPYQEAVYPYGPPFSYLFWAAGVLTTTFGSDASGLVRGTSQVTFVIKGINVLFGFGDAVLIFLILGKMGASRPWQLVGASLFLFNPAVWFSMSVWGQTHVISMFPLLLSLWLAETNHPVGAWSALFLAALTRPQMLIPSLLVGAVLLRKFGLARTLWGGSWATIVLFLVCAPLSLQTSPSLPFDSVMAIIATQESGTNEKILTVLSNDAYSVWPLVSGLVQNLHGAERFSLQSDRLLLSNISYRHAGLYLTTGLLAITGLVLLLRPSSRRARGYYLPFLAFGMTAFLMLVTGLAPTHFILALPLLLLCFKWVPKPLYVGMALLWSSTTLLSMWGSLGLAIDNVRGLSPLFAQLSVTQMCMGALRDDQVVAAAVSANVLVTLCLLGAAIVSLFTGIRRTNEGRLNTVQVESTNSDISVR